MRIAPAAAPAVQIQNTLPVPDAEILVHPAGEERGGRVAHKTQRPRTGRPAVCAHPAPEAALTVRSGVAVNQVEFPAAHLQIQVIGQDGQEAQDAAADLGRAAVDQFPIGGHTAVLPPKLPGAILVPGAQRVQTHLLVVSKKQRDIAALQNLLQELHAMGTPVDDIAQDVEMVPAGKGNLLQHRLKPVQLAVNIRHAVVHIPHLPKKTGYPHRTTPGAEIQAPMAAYRPARGA